MEIRIDPKGEVYVRFGPRGPYHHFTEATPAPEVFIADGDTVYEDGAGNRFDTKLDDAYENGEAVGYGEGWDDAVAAMKDVLDDLDKPTRTKVKVSAAPAAVAEAADRASRVAS